jgi:hypothetical protein
VRGAAGQDALQYGLRESYGGGTLRE